MSHFSDEQAIEIWIKRWSGVPVQKMIQEYGGCNNWRFYEVFQEITNAGTRDIAQKRFFAMFPNKAGKVDTSPHVPKRKLVAKNSESQSSPDLFSRF